jgi:hypothetical protein
MNYVHKIFITFLLLVTMTKVFAKLDFEDHAFPEFVTSARALAMGNAYINKVDDSWSAFYNPAGLGTVRQPQFHLANLHLEASSGLIDIIDDGPAYKMPLNYLDSFDLENMRTELADKQGKLAHSRFNFFPNFTVRGLTLGYFVSQRYRSIINDDVENKFEVAERKDQGPVMSLNGSLFGGVFKLGITGVYLSRTDLYKSFLPTEPAIINGSDYKKGSTLQLTAGARLIIPVEYLPTFSAVLRNSTANGFEDIRAGGSPEEIKQTWDAGFSITPQVGQSTRLHVEFNLKDVNNAYDTDYKRRAAMGIELDFNRSIFFRAGTGDGWGSGGIGFRNRKVILDLTTYAVDRSLDGFRKEEDRRWVLSFASGL